MNSTTIRAIKSVKRTLELLSKGKKVRTIHTAQKASGAQLLNFRPGIVTGIAVAVSFASTIDAVRPSCEENETKMEKEWDNFMEKSMNPDDDDDDDDDGDDNDSEDYEEEIEQGKTNASIDGGHRVDKKGQLDQSKTTYEQGQKDSYEDVPEEDEPTNCTICLINRQGPCRMLWRKFERCMKDHSATEKNDSSTEKDDESVDSPAKVSLEEACDRYMLPWIQCIQGYRNTYTLISNNFFQDEFVDDLEKAVEESDKVDFDIGKDISSIIQIEHLWWEKEQERDDNGVCLVGATARINLVDEGNGRRIAIAYIRDQDGKLLGYNQFHSLKKELEEAEEKRDTRRVGSCDFHVNPETTKGIQVFALYHGQDFDADKSSERESDEEKSQVLESSKQTLYRSSLIAMEEMTRPISTPDSGQIVDGKLNEVLEGDPPKAS
jgi:hypothetical protein